uniref:Uncharacterized protein n=1 Tax=Anopheles farauti TaxID=69004 RepID=A0A182Q9K3_9DIPT
MLAESDSLKKIRLQITAWCAGPAILPSGFASVSTPSGGAVWLLLVLLLLMSSATFGAHSASADGVSVATGSSCTPDTASWAIGAAGSAGGSFAVVALGLRL